MTKCSIETEEKIACFHCKREFPPSPYYFYRKKASKTGYDPKCKECWGRKFGVHQPNKVLKAQKGFKYCARCKKELQYKSFSLNAANKDGYHYSCKGCESIRGKEYDSRPEVKRRAKAYARKWRKTYYATEHGRAMNLKHVNIRRSRKEGTVYNYSEQTWQETLEHFDNECAYCGDNTKPLHQEHVIPLSKGGYYTKQNIIPSCQFCNSSKHARDLDDWYPEQPFFSSEKLKKIKKWTKTDKENNQQLQLL